MKGPSGVDARRSTPHAAGAGRSPRLLLLSLAILVLGPDPARPAQEPARPATEAAGPAPAAEEVRALVAAIAPVVEEIRGLRFKEAVAVEVADDAVARRHFEGRLRTQRPASRMRLDQEAYADLGLLPRGARLEEILLDTLEEQAGGYYDPARGTFVVLGDMPSSMAPIIVAHELTHALDDQHFGIDMMIEEPEEADGRAGGAAAVVEGSGTLVMTLFILRELQDGRLTPDSARELQESEAGQARRLKAAPQVVQRSLVGPYMLGMNFLLRGDLASLSRETVPRADLDRAFRDPPVSWEQILHPEKFWNEEARDPPRRIILPDLAPTLGEGWVLEGEGGLGEMLLAILTDPGAESFDPMSIRDPRAWSNTAAAGWGGDRWQVYRRGHDTATVLATLWDTVRDAREFRGALAAASRRAVHGRGDAVVIVAGAAGDRAPALARAVLRALRAPGSRGRFAAGGLGLEWRHAAGPIRRGSPSGARETP